MKYDQPQIIDLFAGAGGFSLGFERAGWTISGAIEHNEKYTKTHEKNFKGCRTMSADITQTPPEAFAAYSELNSKSPSIIIGGPPCQTFSTIGTPKINSLKFQFKNPKLC